MRDRMASIWQRLNDSLWFVPGLIVLVSVVLALELVRLSTLHDALVIARYPRLFGASAESAGIMLSTIAGSMVTVAGVTFSIMVLAVSQASSQYTPRVMRNFMRDRLSQVTLGTLVGVFVYCLVVLRTVRTEGEVFVPGIAVLAAMILGLLAVSLLMYFIHHIASTLEAGAILDSVVHDTLHSIDYLYPDPWREDSPSHSHDTPSTAANLEWQPILSDRSGYIQHLDADGLTRTAEQFDAVLRMERAVGEFVAAGTPLAAIAGHAADHAVATSVNDQYVIGTYRTVFQDASFGIRQMVDIALKALSPAVNDSTTAVACVDYLAAVLVRVASRQIPPSEWIVRDKVRVIARVASFDEMLHEAFSEIRRNAFANLRVLMRCIGALEVVAKATRSAHRRAAIAWQVERFRDALREVRGVPSECQAAIATCERVQALLARTETPHSTARSGTTAATNR